MGFSQSEPNENLEAAVFEIAFQRDQGTGAAFFDLAHEAHDFGMMEEKFARTIRFRVGPVSMAVGGDVEGVEPGLPVFDAAVGMRQISASGTDGFDFGTGKDDAGLDGLGDGVMMTRLAVVDFDRFQGA